MGKTPAPTRPRGSYMRGVDGEAKQEEEVVRRGTDDTVSAWQDEPVLVDVLHRQLKLLGGKKSECITLEAGRIDASPVADRRQGNLESLAGTL